MLKKLIIFILTLTIHDLNAQVLNCKISGSFKEKTDYEFAHISNPETKKNLITRINDGKFIFTIAKPLEIEVCFLYFDKDSVSDYEELIKKWEGLQRPKMIAIEDAKIFVNSDAKTSVVEGGEFNTQISKFNQATRTRDFKIFLDVYPDSPLAITLLRTYVILLKMPEYYDENEPSVLYNKLSERLKNSPQGMKIKKDLRL